MSDPLKKEKKIYTHSDYATWPDFENYLEGKTCEVFNSPFDVLMPSEKSIIQPVLTVC